MYYAQLHVVECKQLHSDAHDGLSFMHLPRDDLLKLWILFLPSLMKAYEYGMSRRGRV